MTAEQFVYWLQGYFEIGNPTSLFKDEIGVIRDHLELVLEKKTPDRTLLKEQLTTLPVTTSPYTVPVTPNTTNPYTVTCTGMDPNSTATGRLIC